MAENSIRIDKWLWHARVVKTRSLSQKLVLAGKVRVNREKTVSASRQVKPGDVLTITLDRQICVYEIAAIGHRRGPYSEACKLYIDHSPPAQKTGSNHEHPSPQKRPDRRQRRALAELRGKII
ncbi:MAG: RNA-binding S4 domain-containing protein [Pseudomonadota bacterium]